MSLKRAMFVDTAYRTSKVTSGKLLDAYRFIPIH